MCLVEFIYSHKYSHWLMFKYVYEETAHETAKRESHKYCDLLSIDFRVKNLIVVFWKCFPLHWGYKAILSIDNSQCVMFLVQCSKECSVNLGLGVFFSNDALTKYQSHKVTPIHLAFPWADTCSNLDILFHSLHVTILFFPFVAVSPHPLTINIFL